MLEKYHYLSKGLLRTTTKQRDLIPLNQIVVKKNSTQPFTEEDLFGVAERDNPKRAFLFVSKILARHIPVEVRYPVMLNAYQKLAEALDAECENLKAQKILVISMAETATQIGLNILRQGRAWTRADIDMIHTTRQPVPNVPLCCTLEESHSHNTTHYLHDIPQLSNYDTLVLVDDEYSTGNTAHNLVKALQEQGVKPKNIVTVSLIDWREDLSVVRDLDFGYPINERAITLYAGEFCFLPTLSIPISALQTGKLEIGGLEYQLNNVAEEDYTCEMPKFTTKVENSPIKTLISMNDYLKGISNDPVSAVTCDKTSYYAMVKARKEAKGKTILVVAFGENHYVAEQFAQELKTAGAQSVELCSLTRSPIIARNSEDYPIRSKKVFNVADGTKRYLYNVDPTQYNEVYFVMDGNYLVNGELSGYSKGLTDFCKLHGNVILLNNCQLDFD